MGSDERVVELLNASAVSTDASKKLESLRIVQEIIINKEPHLLDNFLDEVIGFQKDRSQDVRKFVVGFIEAASKKDPEMLPKVVANLKMLISDSAVAVQKRVIQAMTHLYRVSLTWLCRAKTVTKEMEEVWNVISEIKNVIIGLLDADNDGIRTHTVKFMEMLVILQTHRESKSMTPSRPEVALDFDLSDVPLTLKKIVRRRTLEEEAGAAFEELIKYHGSLHISSANLMACMGALTNIAKNRPVFLSKVITAFEMLQANLPPTLAKSQVSSVRKHLKNQLLALLKHPAASEEFFTNITTLLTDLGASKEEVMKAMPTAFEEMRRRARKSEKAAAIASGSRSGQSRAKRARLDERAESEVEPVEQDYDEDDDDDEGDDDDKEKMTKSQMESAIDITEKFILDKLTPVLATELVMMSMKYLPAEIPPQFHNAYTPIAAAGTEGQVKHVSRLLATQLTAAQLGPGIEVVSKMEATSQGRKSKDDDDDEEDDKEETAAKISTVIAGKIGGDDEKTATSKKNVTLQPAGMTSGTKKSRTRVTMRLADITHPLTHDERKNMIFQAMQRVLASQKAARDAGVGHVRDKALAALSAQLFAPEVKHKLLAYVLDDLGERLELAMSLLYEEYCIFQGFTRLSPSAVNKRSDDTEYNTDLCSLVTGIRGLDSKDKEKMLRKIYLEAPTITEGAIQLLKDFIQDKGTAVAVVKLMKDLVTHRPTKKLNFLNFLLEFCSHELVQVRETANETIMQLYSDGDFNEIIEGYSVMYLRFLLAPAPPDFLFGIDRGRDQKETFWTEDIVRVCLHLPLSLLPRNLKLFKDLAEVYKETSADVKRNILRNLDSAVRNVDMDDPDLLEFIESCPKGSETLVTRVIHILTDRSMPSPQLVNKVREVYESKVSDVRFLIPVLNGLKKHEVVAALPKLISLSPTVVKEAFYRLLNNTVSNGPLSPSDLLIALHNIDPNKSDAKTIIKATSLCFQDKQTFTQEVLAIVLQQLMEQPQVPLLFMRTVIQAVAIYPQLVGFVMNILQRLIVKKVWKEPKIWDGFVRCCEKTIPQSYVVMLQLPPAQLRLMLDTVPNVREPLLEHVQSFTEAQRAHVSAATMEVLYDADVKAEKRARFDEDFDDAPG